MIRVIHRFFNLGCYLTICTLFMVSGCSSIPTSVVSTSPVTTQEAGYPPPEASMATEQVSAYPGSSDYPAPAQVTGSSSNPYPSSGDTATPVILATSGPPPSPGPATGVVTGRVFADDKPVTNGILWLAEVVKDGKGVERIAGYSRDSSPRALIDSEGRFYFSNVSPGKYGLVLDLVVATYLLHVPGTEKQLLFEVKAGEEVDLEDLDYDSLPVPFP